MGQIAEKQSALSVTLGHALEKIEFYRRLPLAMGKSPELGDFPIVNGDQIAEQPELFYCLDSFPDFVVTTGGSTGGKCKFFFLNLSELDSAYAAKTQAKDHTRRFDPDDFDGIGILLGDNQHGHRYSSRRGQPIINLPLESGRHLELVLRFLTEGIVVKGKRYPVVELYGSITKLKALTLFLESDARQKEIGPLRRIVTTSFYASDQWKRRLENFWNGCVDSAYGLTEFNFSVNPPCKYCGALHLSSLAEVEYLKPDLSGPADEGMARLVLTSLYPYRKAMPLIRYDTRDLAILKPYCPHAEKRGFDFLGRLGSVSWKGNGADGRWLSPFDIVDALEAVESTEPNSVCFDESVPLVMSWGSALDPNQFRQAGYLRMNLSGGGSHQPLQATVESDCRNKTAKARMTKQFFAFLDDRLNDRMRQKEDSRNFVSIKWVEPNGLAKRNLTPTLV